MLKFYSLLGILIFSFFSLNAQRSSLLNPGFEDLPRHSDVPKHWINCGSPGESPPDILPEPTFQVETAPYTGNTYLGLVTRDNDTWEAVGANLSEPLAVNTCYRFSLAMARSLSYYSVSRAKNIPANYVSPTRLRIWGSNRDCSRDELLAESPLVTHSRWQLYTFIVKPTENSYSSIILEVFYPAGINHPTNGNLLLDGASAFEVLPDCQLENFTMPGLDATSETVKITGNGTSINDDTEDPVALKLPDADYFKDEEALRSFLVNILDDLNFNDQNQLLLNEFYLPDEAGIRSGHPAWYALQYALQFYPDQKWELVIYTDNTIDQELRVLELGQQLSTINDISLSVNAYSSEQYDGMTWFCMSVANGLYLRKVE